MTFRPAILAGIFSLPLLPLPAAAAPKDADLISVWKKCKAKSFDARKLGEGGGYSAETRARLLDGGATDSAIPYFACLSLIPGQERACEGFPSLQGVPAEAGPTRRCRELAAYARSAAGVLLPPGDGLRACRAYLEVIGLTSRPGAGDAPCDSWTKAMKDGDVKAFCLRGAALGLIGPAEQARCPELFSAFAGDPARCSPKNTAFCAESAALLKGLRSADKAECRAAPLCAALTSRKPEACTPYLERANTGICEWIVKSGFLNEDAMKTNMPPTESDKAAVNALLQKEKDKTESFKKIRAETDIEKAREIEAEKFKIAEARRQERERLKALEKQFKPGEAMNKGPVPPAQEKQDPRRKP